MKVFTNPSQDSELRINAYLSIMPCADEQVIAKVKDMLEAEKVNQVGSFVWTHLTNLMESSSPHKQNIADIIDNANLKVCVIFTTIIICVLVCSSSCCTYTVVCTAEGI